MRIHHVTITLATLASVALAPAAAQSRARGSLVPSPHLSPLAGRLEAGPLFGAGSARDLEGGPAPLAGATLRLRALTMGPLALGATSGYELQAGAGTGAVGAEVLVSPRARVSLRAGWTTGRTQMANAFAAGWHRWSGLDLGVETTIGRTRVGLAWREGVARDVDRGLAPCDQFGNCAPLPLRRRDERFRRLAIETRYVLF